VALHVDPAGGCSRWWPTTDCFIAQQRQPRRIDDYRVAAQINPIGAIAFSSAGRHAAGVCQRAIRCRLYGAQAVSKCIDPGGIITVPEIDETEASVQREWEQKFLRNIMAVGCPLRVRHEKVSRPNAVKIDRKTKCSA
jgi:hypothetical protein